MTEAEWLACDDPHALLRQLGGRATERKLRLFACACCRRVSFLLVDRRTEKALEVAERYAEGEASEEELFAAMSAARQASSPADIDAQRYAAEAVVCAAVGVGDSAGLLEMASTAADRVVLALTSAASEVLYGDARKRARPTGRYAAYAEARREVCDLLRDVFGNPFRPVALDPAWLGWTGGLVRKLAGAIYDERRFGELPVLADALEEAGCASAEVLGHLRGPGPHVRGCWVVDRLLGKE